MNKTDLKIIMNEFNTRSNRLLRADFNDYMNILRKFVAYIESTEIIKEYIDNCGGYDAESEDVIQSVNSNDNYYFDLGDTEDEEVSVVYSVIKYMSEKYKEVPIMLIMAYSDSRKYADKLKAFNERFVLALISNIDKYLTKVGIQMGLDENVVCNVSGNQVNIANDNATINATQNNNGINADELKSLIAAMRESLDSSLSEEDKQEATECIDTIETELLSPQPNETIVKDKFKLLRRIDTGAKFLNTCCSLLAFADKIHPFLADISTNFQALIR